MPSGDVFPRRNLPGDAEDWGRKVEGRITDLETALSGVGDTVGNQGRSNSGALALISDQIKQLAEVQAQQAETLATVQAVQADLAAQQAALTATQNALQAQANYLQSLTVTSASTTTDITTFQGWAPNSLRPQVTVRTSTGKLRITVSGTVGSAFMVYSIAGQVTRESRIDGSRLFDSLNATSDVNHTVGASKQFTVVGLPTNTDLVVTAETYSPSAVGFAARVGIIVEVIP